MKPFFILNMSNVHVLFDYIKDNDYKYGYNSDPSPIPIDLIKRDIIKDLDIRKSLTYEGEQKKCMRTSYLELDEKNKRFMIYSKWESSNEIIDYILRSVVRITDFKNFRIFLSK